MGAARSATHLLDAPVEGLVVQVAQLTGLPVGGHLAEVGPWARQPAGCVRSLRGGGTLRGEGLCECADRAADCRLIGFGGLVKSEW